MIQQVILLLKRILIISKRGHPVKLAATFVWPPLMLYSLLLSFKNSRKEQSVYDLVPLAATSHFFCLIDYLVADRTSGFRSLMSTMNMRRSAYLVSFLIIASIFIGLVLVLAFCNLLALGEQVAEGKPVANVMSVELVAIFCLYGLELVGQIIFLGSLVSKTQSSVLSVIILVLDVVFFQFLKDQMQGDQYDRYKLILMAFTNNSIKIVPELSHENRNWLIGSMAVWTFIFLSVGFFIQLEHGHRLSNMFLKGQKKSRDKHLDSSIKLMSDHLNKMIHSAHVVDDVCLELRRDRTTVLLGSNCAGKTTLVRLLTGELAASSGNVSINSDQPLGYCPQVSVLDQLLTVREHLELFYDLKAGPRNQRRQHIDTLLADLNLAEHSNKRPAQLSGGLRRSLSLALALVGPGEVLILDEPSSGRDIGLDGHACQVMWGAVVKYRQGRALLLATHLMEEAEFLHDEIVIMRHGKLSQPSTSEALKGAIELRYKLRVEVERVQDPNVVKLVQTHFARSQVIEDEFRSGCVFFNLQLGLNSPNSYDENLVDLVKDLEGNGSRVGCKSFELRCSTLDDVMLRYGGEDAFETQSRCSRNGEPSLELTVEDFVSVNRQLKSTSSCLSTLRVVQILLKKQLHLYSSAKTLVFIFRVLIPAVRVTIWIIAGDRASLIALIVRKDFITMIFDAHFIYFPSLEKVTGFKSAQLIAGSSTLLSWMVHLIFDLIPPLMVFAIRIPFSHEEYTIPPIKIDVNWFDSFLILLEKLDIHIIFLAYCLSGLFSDYSASTVYFKLILSTNMIVEYLYTIFKLYGEVLRSIRTWINLFVGLVDRTWLLLFVTHESKLFYSSY